MASVGRAQAPLCPWILDIIELFSSFTAQFAFMSKQRELYLVITSAAPHSLVYKIPLKERCQERLLTKSLKS